ncbi:hypothetical protein J1N35_016826 [Gossypium stocksii]|uniref:Uncharacterized protein n=1 Tax=Gossypium stocksii TaxID=47602 RepID=A0A9D3VLB2_9ROSI|nr:hypothetical protein J1N35_016826 [Gossypium stocksii]
MMVLLNFDKQDELHNLIHWLHLVSADIFQRLQLQLPTTSQVPQRNELLLITLSVTTTWTYRLRVLSAFEWHSLRLLYVVISSRGNVLETMKEVVNYCIEYIVIITINNTLSLYFD